MPDPSVDPRAQQLLAADPGEIFALAGLFRSVSDQAGTAAAGLRSAQADVTWTGSSADRFRSKVGELPAHLDRIEASHADAASALETYATDLDPMKREFWSLRERLAEARWKLGAAWEPAARVRWRAEVWQLEWRGNALLDEFEELRGISSNRVSQAGASAPAQPPPQPVVPPAGIPGDTVTPAGVALPAGPVAAVWAHPGGAGHPAAGSGPRGKHAKHVKHVKHKAHQARAKTKRRAKHKRGRSKGRHSHSGSGFAIVTIGPGLISIWSPGRGSGSATVTIGPGGTTTTTTGKGGSGSGTTTIGPGAKPKGGGSGTATTTIGPGGTTTTTTTGKGSGTATTTIGPGGGTTTTGKGGGGSKGGSGTATTTIGANRRFVPRYVPLRPDQRGN